MPRHTEASEELFKDFVGTLTTPARMNGYTVRERHGQAQLLQTVDLNTSPTRQDFASFGDFTESSKCGLA